MKEETTYYNGLIAAYFSGETTPEEIELLSVWLTEDKANLDLFEEYRKTWLLTGKDAISSGLNIDTEWTEISKRMEQSEVSAPTSLPTPGKGRLVSMLTSWKAAAALIVLLGAAAVLFYLNSGPDMMRVTADSGTIEQILPDGSVISLYKGSVIEFPSDFSENTREIKLDGEAYFSVVHDVDRPFIVSGNNARIKVLGTSFDVNTRVAENQISVVLTTGKISLYFKGKESENTILNPGEKAEISTSAKVITKSTNSDPNYMAWKTGKIVFDNTGLNQVIATISKVYQTEIRLADQQLNGCSLTATFEKQSLNSVLSVIGTTLDLTVSEENGVIVLNGIGCN